MAVDIGGTFTDLVYIDDGAQQIIDPDYFLGGEIRLNPLERDPEAVCRDVLNGYVSVERAEKDYGVIIDHQALQIDYQAQKKEGVMYDKRLHGKNSQGKFVQWRITG